VVVIVQFRVIRNCWLPLCSYCDGWPHSQALVCALAAQTQNSSLVAAAFPGYLLQIFCNRGLNRQQQSFVIGTAEARQDGRQKQALRRQYQSERRFGWRNNEFNDGLITLLLSLLTDIGKSTICLFQFSFLASKGKNH